MALPFEILNQRSQALSGKWKEGSCPERMTLPASLDSSWKLQLARSASSKLAACEPSQAGSFAGSLLDLQSSGFLALLLMI